MIINESTFKDAYNDYFEIVCRFLNYYTRFVCLWEDYEEKEILNTNVVNCTTHRAIEVDTR